MRTFTDKVNSAVKNWWVSLLLGILYIALAIFLLMNPMATYVTLSILFSAFMFVSGIFEIIFAVNNKDNISSWGWYLAGGILDLLIGILLIAIPGLSMEVLPFILAFWLMFRGFTGIGVAIDMRRYGVTNWGWVVFLSIIAILFAVGIIWMPAIGALSFVFIAAYAFIAFGIFRIMLAFELKNLHKRNEDYHRKSGAAPRY